MSAKQYWYLKRKYEAERAAWCAYFDVTGETPDEAWERQNRELRQRAAERSAVNFDPESLGVPILPVNNGIFDTPN